MIIYTKEIIQCPLIACRFMQGKQLGRGQLAKGHFVTFLKMFLNNCRTLIECAIKPFYGYGYVPKETVEKHCLILGQCNLLCQFHALC